MRRVVWVAGLALAALCAVPLADWLSSGGGLRSMPSRPYLDRPLILAAFVPYALGLVALRRTNVDARVVAGIGIACVALLVAVPPRASQDVFSYLFYGRMWEHGGLNPMTTAPSAFGADPWFAFVRWPDTPSAYGPLWVAATGGFSAAAGGHVWIALALAKAVTAAGALAGALFVHRSLSGTGSSRPAWGLAFVLWNPLVLFSVAGDGHVDGALLGLVAAAVLARLRGRMGWATAALAAAALVKPYTGLLLVLHLAAMARANGGRDAGVRRALRHAGAAAAGAVIAYAPFWAGARTFEGLRDVSRRFSATPARDLRRAVAATLDAMGMDPVSARTWGSGVARGAGAAILAAVVIWCLRGGLRDRPAAVWGVALGAYLLVTPWFLPWHAVPLIALAAAAGDDAPPLSAGALALGPASLVAVPAVRFGVPAVAALLSSRGREGGAHGIAGNP